LEEVWSGEGARFSQIAMDYLRNRVVVVGLARDSGGLPRSAVFVFNPSSEGVDVVVHRNTGEINMFKSVIYDHVYRRFIVGERGYGVDASSDGSNWPNGGGLWVIPYEDLMDYTRWVRVHEFGGNPEVTSIGIRANNHVYVGLWRDGSVSRIVMSDITNLVSWDTTVLVRLDVKSHVDTEGNTAVLPFVELNNLFRIIAFRDIFHGMPTFGTVGGNVKYLSGKVVGKYFVMTIGKTSMTSDICFTEIGSSSFSVVRADVDSVVDGKRFLYDGKKNLYIGSVAGLGSAKVYRLSFDYGRVLELDVSPSVVEVGDTVTLTAVLRDSDGMPVSGAHVDFYVANSAHSSPAGRLIGTRTTDETGTASITYTVSASPERLIFFAIYRG